MGRYIPQSVKMPGDISFRTMTMSLTEKRQGVFLSACLACLANLSARPLDDL